MRRVGIAREFYALGKIPVLCLVQCPVLLQRTKIIGIPFHHEAPRPLITGLIVRCSNALGQVVELEFDPVNGPACAVENRTHEVPEAVEMLTALNAEILEQCSHAINGNGRGGLGPGTGEQVAAVAWELVEQGVQVGRNRDGVVAVIFCQVAGEMPGLSGEVDVLPFAGDGGAGALSGVEHALQGKAFGGEGQCLDSGQQGRQVAEGDVLVMLVVFGAGEGDGKGGGGVVGHESHLDGPTEDAAQPADALFEGGVLALFLEGGEGGPEGGVVELLEGFIAECWEEVNP